MNQICVGWGGVRCIYFDCVLFIYLSIYQVQLPRPSTPPPPKKNIPYLRILEDFCLRLVRGTSHTLCKKCHGFFKSPWIGLTEIRRLAQRLNSSTRAQSSELNQVSPRQAGSSRVPSSSHNLTLTPPLTLNELKKTNPTLPQY